MADAPAPWPDNRIARWIRRHPRNTAALVALVVGAAGAPALGEGLRDLAWMDGTPEPVPAALEAIADGSAFGEGEAGWFRIEARPFAELTLRAARAADSAEPEPLPYVAIGRKTSKGREIAAVVRIAGEPARAGWASGKERSFEAIARRGERLPDEVAALFAAADPQVPWADLPLLVEGAPDRGAALRRATLGGAAVGLAALAFLGAVAGGRGAPSAPRGRPLPRRPERREPAATPPARADEAG